MRMSRVPVSHFQSLAIDILAGGRLSLAHMQSRFITRSGRYTFIHKRPRDVRKRDKDGATIEWNGGRIRERESYHQELCMAINRQFASLTTEYKETHKKCRNSLIHV